MKIEDIGMYPEYKKKAFDIVLLKKIILYFFLITSLITLIVNLAIGGKMWFLYVIGGQAVFWFVFMSDAMVESGILRKVVQIAIVVSLFLFLVDQMAGNSGWAINVVIPIICFSAVIALSIIFFIQFKRRLTNILYFYVYLILGLFSILLGFVGVIKISWPWIVLASCSLASLILTIVLYRGQIIHEFKKKFHMR
ncbi:MAG: DUF6320 domain-containing protein [Bacilli bacterium]|nr:DUF6320 domain-containing protein [Bacilli bacterium]